MLLQRRPAAQPGSPCNRPPAAAAAAAPQLGMEAWARHAHRLLWHGLGWALHQSHHAPRAGLFEANDLYALVNAAPAVGLCAYGFRSPGLLGACCFGAGLGITLYGMAYMFVHDGLVHRCAGPSWLRASCLATRCAAARLPTAEPRGPGCLPLLQFSRRFPVGPIARVPLLRRIAAAHQLHHTGRLGGAPWGMFLGPQEVEALPGGRRELDMMVAAGAERPS